jgi:hypothetical protein
MRVSRSFLFLVAAGVSLQATSIVRADNVLAADNAANYIPGGGWNDANNNQGTGTPGFTSPWVFTSTTGSSFIGLSSLDPSTAQWELQGDDNVTSGGSFASAERSFPAISASGGYITLDLDANNVDSNGFIGVGFANSSNTPQISLLVQPSGLYGEDYFIDAGSLSIDTGISANGDFVHLDLSILPVGYSVTLQQDATTVSIPVLSGPTDEISNVTFFDSGSITPFYLNNLTVVPIPTAAVAATPLLALLAIGKLKRR